MNKEERRHAELCRAGVGGFYSVFHLTFRLTVSSAVLPEHLMGIVLQSCGVN